MGVLILVCRFLSLLRFHLATVAFGPPYPAYTTHFWVFLYVLERCNFTCIFLYYLSSFLSILALWEDGSTLARPL